MKLHPVDDVPFSAGESVFRTSPLGTALFALGLAAAPAATAWLGLLGGGVPLVLWPIAGVCALLLLVFGPAAARGFGRDNWLLRCRAEGVALKLRSHWNADLPRADAVVALIAAEELRGVRRTAGRRTLPGLSGRGENADTTERVVFLDLLLRHEQTDELAAALRRERERQGRGRTHFHHYPVALAAPDLVRVTWSDRHGRVVPGIRRALEQLGRVVPRLEDVELDAKSWRALEGADLDDFVLELVEAGETIEAVKVLRLRHGWDLTRAKSFVDELRAA